jgi:hypothetical protein
MKKQQPLVVRRGTAEFTLTRIDDRALEALGLDAVQVEEDHLFWMHWHSPRREPRPLGLARFFLMMCQRFGDSAVMLDTYKSSFCFPFRMATSKQERSGDYLVLVGDWKGGLRVKLFRRGAEHHGDDRNWIDFVEEEFSREDFRFLVNYLDGYLEAFEENYREQIVVEAPDFLHDVEGAQVLYGYKDGRPFVHEFEDGDEYQKMRARLLEELGDWRARLVANLEWHRAAYSTFTIATIAKELGVGQMH